MSGNVGTKKSDLPDTQMENTTSDDQDQSRVKFGVVETARTSEPDSWRVKQARHHAVRTESVASKDSKAPRKGTTMRGGGRRANISAQQVPVDLKVHSRSADGPSLVARRVYRVPTSELQTTEIGVTGDSIFSAEPGRERDTSSSRNSGNDKAVGRGSTVKGITLELRPRGRVDSDTTIDISNSTRSRERLGPGEAGLPEADTNREISENDTSQILKGHEVFVSHKWGRAADKVSKDAEKQSAKRVVQPRQVTNVKSMGNVYSATINYDECDEKITADISSSHKRSLDDQQRIYAPEVKTEETAPASVDEAAKLSEWRNSMRAEVKALQNRGCWQVIKTPKGV